MHKVLKKNLRYTLLTVVWFFYSFAAAHAAPLSSDDFIRLCLEGSGKDVQAAINEGADVNSKTPDDGMHVLVFALQNPDVGALRALINAGADIHYRWKGCSAIQVAALYAGTRPEALEALVKARANLKELRDGSTLLHDVAANTRNPECLKVLVKAGLNVNIRDEKGNGMTPLMTAAISQANEDVIFTLLDLGADPKLRNRDGFVALDFLKANEQGLAKSSVLDRLVRDGNVPDFLELCKLGRANEIKTALKQGASPNASREQGFTALMAAAMFNDKKAVATLVEAGADVNARCDDGGTALFYAALRTQDPEVVRYLLKAGAKANIRVDGFSALDFARNNESLANTKALRELEHATQQ